MQTRRLVAAIAVLLVLTGCQVGQPQDIDEAESSASPANGERGETVSILRADIEQPDLPRPPLENLEAVIGFPEGGAALDEQAVAVLEDVLTSEQITLGLPIVLNAHSDSGGSDKVNADVAEARGLAVATWLIERGVNSETIDVIVFGEQNPVEPNALPDGSPNEAGRAANRRVEVFVSAERAGVDRSEDESSAQAGD